MTNTRHCSVLIKESPAVLSWEDDIYLMHHTHQQNIKPSHTLVHMNMISIVINGEKEIIDGDCRTVAWKC